MDQIEKFIETQKLKNKSQGNNYEKNYGTVSGRNAGSATYKIQQMEDALGLMRNKESALGATSSAAAGRKRTGQQSGGAGTQMSTQHLEQDERWLSLNKKEK